MKKQPTHPTDILRQKAEASMKNKSSKTAAKLSEVEILKLIHELEVHQVELEMQNEELKLAKEKAELDKEKYNDLFDFAPSGYFTLSDEGVIIELNLCASNIIGKERSLLRNKNFGFFVSVSTRETYNLFLEKVFTCKGKESCELSLSINDLSPKYVHLIGILTENRKQCLVNMIDITERKLLEESIRLQTNAMEATIDGLAILNADQKYIYINKSHANIYGYDNAGELIGKSWRVLYDNDELQRFDKEIMPELSKNGHYHGRSLGKKKDGSKYPQSLSLTTLDNGGLICVVRDISEIMKSEEVIKNAISFQQVLMDAIPAPIFYKDKNLMYIGGNKAFEQYIGMNREQFIGKTVYDLSPPDLAEIYEKADRELLKNSKAQIYETSVMYADGTLHDVIFNKATFTNTKGNVAGLIGVILDITERKQAEELTRESEEKYRMLINTANESIIIAQDGFLKFVNPSVLILLAGYSEQELLDKPFQEFIHPDDRSMVVENYKKRIAKETILPRYTFRVINRNGIVKWVEISANLIEWHGKPATLNFLTNITERKLAEESLIFNNIILHTQQETSIDGILVVDEKGKILSYNQRFVKLWGITPDIIETKSDEKALQSVLDKLANPEEFMQKVKYLYEFKDKISKDEITLKDGRSFDRYSAPMFGADKKYYGRVWYFRDISKRKKEEQELIKAKERAEESDRLKSAFLANMSHEIRTPMNAILGFTYLMKEPKLTSEDQKEFISIIEKSSVRLLNIINDIISISKIESGQMNVYISETNINEQFEYIYAFFKPEAEQKGLQLFLKNTLPAERATIKTDVEKIYAILINLVKNAIKFTKTGSIEFGIVKKGEYLEFFVKDTGIGISKEQKEIIFERFRQGSETF
ncbi:MAG: PAS domain S-box protein, partial [Bacteroidetes bacterium]|nr:PAS domain S-box protein [Bacteroidota bacterium]